MSKKQKIKVELKDDGLVLYCDAGARPNPGVAGWGLHGYFYDESLPKKGAGLKYKLTQSGYKLKTEEANKAVTEITPTKYYNAFGNFDHHTTNSVAEVAAVTEAFKVAQEYKVKNLYILTDSEQTIKACTEWISTWKKNNWIKSNGTPVANVQWLKAVDEAMGQAKANGINYKFEWVKGHSGNLGNDSADANATAAIMYTNQGIPMPKPLVSEADSYWLKDSKRPALLFHPNIFFTSDQDILQKEFYTSSANSELDLIGKRSYGVNYGYVILNEAPPEIVSVKKKQQVVCEDSSEVIMQPLKYLYSQACEMLVNLHKEHAFLTTGKRNKSLKALNDEPITNHLSPPLIAHRTFEASAHLKGLYEKFIIQANQNELVNLIDVTPQLYEVNEKSKLQLKKSIPLGVASISLDVTALNEPIKLDCFLGLDLPSRNALKAVEELNPKVYVLTEATADKSAYRYYFILQCDLGACVCAAIFSNIKSLKK